MQVFLSVAPRDARAALQFHNRLAHVAYRIGEESRLLRQNLPQSRGGILSLSDYRCPPIEKPEALCREILQECNLRSYGGVLADFEEAASQDRLTFLEKLCGMLGRSSRRLFLPAAAFNSVWRRPSAALAGIKWPLISSGWLWTFAFPPPAALGRLWNRMSFKRCSVSNPPLLSIPAISVHATSPTPGRVRPISFSTTMRRQSGKKSAPAMRWVCAPLSSCTRKSRTCCPPCSAVRETGRLGGPSYERTMEKSIKTRFFCRRLLTKL